MPIDFLFVASKFKVGYRMQYFHKLRDEGGAIMIDVLATI